MEDWILEHDKRVKELYQKNDYKGIDAENKRYAEEYNRKLISGEYKIEYTDEYYKKEAEKEKYAAEKKYAHPDTMDKKSAAVLLAVGMVGSLIFKQWYLVWVMLLLWYLGKDRV